MSGNYTFGKTVEIGFKQALERVTQELAKEGFGVLTEIDVAATLKKKLGKDMPPTGSSAPAIRSWRTARSKPNRRSARCCRATLSCAPGQPARRSSRSWTREPS